MGKWREIAPILNLPVKTGLSLVSSTQKQYFFYDKNEYEEYEESFGGIIEIQELRKILPINETNPSYTIVELQELENELNNNPKLLLEP